VAKIRCEFVSLYQSPYRFDALRTEVIDQRFAQVPLNRQVRLVRQKPQDTLNRYVQVDFAEQITRIESKFPRPTRKQLTDTEDNFFAAELRQSKQALIGQETGGMTEVADEKWNRLLQSHLPRQLCHQRLQPFTGSSMGKVPV
jgi:hypothetical protein